MCLILGDGGSKSAPALTSLAGGLGVSFTASCSAESCDQHPLATHEEGELHFSVPYLVDKCMSYIPLGKVLGQPNKSMVRQLSDGYRKYFWLTLYIS
jgi:hypothetical protein